MRCIFNRWDPENSDFTYEDLENAADGTFSVIIPWSIPKSLNPQPGDLCLVSNVDDGDEEGYLAICGQITSVEEESADVCKVIITAYYVDTGSWYPLLPARVFSDLDKTIDFINGPSAELMDEEIVTAFHIMILRVLNQNDAIGLDSADSFFTGEMYYTAQALGVIL